MSSTQDSGNSQPLFPALCKNGCGFFGGIDNQGYCSVCFKKKMKKETVDQNTESEVVPQDDTADKLSKLTLEEKAEVEEVKEELVAKVEEELQKITSTEVDGASAAVAVEGDKEKEEPKENKKKKNRCLSCKKKVGLTGFSCRCGGLFCSIHRYSDKHECNFDYKAMGEKEISEANPVVVAQKINKI